MMMREGGVSYNPLLLSHGLPHERPPGLAKERSEVQM